MKATEKGALTGASLTAGTWIFDVLSNDFDLAASGYVGTTLIGVDYNSAAYTGLALVLCGAGVAIGRKFDSSSGGGSSHSSPQDFSHRDLS